MTAPNMTDYAATCREYRLEVPPDFNFAYDVVDALAADPDRRALVCVDARAEQVDTYTFTDLKTLSNRFANALRGLGLVKGDRVFVMVPRLVEFYVTMLACHKLGVVPMPAASILTPKDCAYRVQRAGAKAAVVHAEHVHKLDAVAGECPTLAQRIAVRGAPAGWQDFDALLDAADPVLERTALPAMAAAEPLLIYFTSGTTKLPKMVVQRHSYALAHSATARFWYDLRPEDLHWTLSDTGWAKFAWGKLYGPWSVGAAVVCHDQQGRFDAARHLELIGRLRVTTFCAPPTAYRMLILEDLRRFDLSSLRHCTAAGEPLNPDVMRVWREATGLTIYDGYGQTETTNLLANFPCVPVRPGSMGKPVPGLHLAIVDDDGRPLPPNEEGNIAVRVRPDYPPGLCEGYFEDPEATARAWVGDWYFTADRGYCDPDGYFWFVGRSDDVIKASGYRIGPFEVESALQSHPAVAESAVVGIPDELRGTIVKAFVVLAPGYVPSDALVTDLQEHVKRETAPYKYPRAVEFLDELPKTVSGKIRRVDLRARG